MSGADDKSVGIAIRLERGTAADLWGPRIARGSTASTSLMARARPQPVRHQDSLTVRDDRAAATIPAREKAAFTLRLDPTRHARLKDACSSTSRSAQQIVTQALDTFLGAASGPALSPRTVRAAIRIGAC